MRRFHALSLAGIAAAALLLAACQPASTTPQPPPAAAYLTDAGHSGVATGVNAGPPMTLAWHSAAVPGTSSGGVPLSDGRSVFSAESVYCGGACTEVAAYDIVTGKLRWGPVEVAGDAVTTLGPQGLYVASKGYVADLDLATGKTLWLAGGIVDGVVPALSVAYGHLYAGQAVFDPNTGKRTATLAFPPYEYEGLLAAVVGGGVYFQNNATVWKDNAVTGKLMWTSDSHVTGGDIGAFPMVAGNRVYLPDKSTPPKFEVLNADTGALVGYTPIKPAAVDATTAYGVAYDNKTGRNDGTSTLEAVSLSTGVVKWSWLAPPHLQGTWVIGLGPVVADGVVYAAVGGESTAATTPGIFRGELVAFDAATGKLLQTVPMDTSPTGDLRQVNGLASLAVVGNYLLVPTDIGIEAFKLTPH